MRNPSRRNRNIGTAKQGYGQDNKLVIPFPSVEMKDFYERLGEYKTVVRVVNEHKFKFIVEKTRQNSFHACTLDDIEKILIQIPKQDYGELELIILRQPSRKEENLKPVWGRLIYSYEFENDFFAALIIEAVSLEKSFKWSKKLSVDAQKELQRLKKDGHNITSGKQYFEAEYELKNIRATQLYRTLPHEFGHYVHYLETVVHPLRYLKEQVVELDKKIDDQDTAESNPLFDKWSKLDDNYRGKIEELEEKYFAIPSTEKEVFAHCYADKLKKKLELKKLIPFDRILDKEKIIKEGLNLEDFKKNNKSISIHRKNITNS